MPNTYFFTTPMYDRMRIAAVGDGDNKEYMLDPNLASEFHFDTVSGNPVMRIDTYPGSFAGSTPPTSGSVDAYGFQIKNYNVDFSSAFVSISGSNSGGTGSPWSLIKAGTHLDLTDGLFYIELSGSAKFKQYQIEFTDLDVPDESAEFAYLLLMQKRSLQQRPDIPLADESAYDNQKVKLRGNKTLKRQNYRIPIISFDRGFRFTSINNRNIINNAWDDCSGNLRYMLYLDTDTASDATLCQFDMKKIKITTPFGAGTDVYETKLSFMTPGHPDPYFGI